MSAPRQELIEFLRLNNLEAGSYLSTDEDNDNDSSPFDTLWTEFARSHPRLSPPRSPILPHSHVTENALPSYCPRSGRPTSPTHSSKATLDLRALEYVTDYDTNLMCPICHIPFIDPVVLDCDHTFCMECFETYRNGGSGSDRSRCPACRTYHLGGSRKANRLIRNMASEVRVKCPNTGCEMVTTRNNMETHALRQCPEEELPCPNTTCTKRTRRKNYLDDICVHASHIDCECGASIRLGRGEWIRHKDEQCPLTVGTTSSSSAVIDPVQNAWSDCPGSIYGCDHPASTSTSSPQELSDHVSTCVLAKLAPFMQKQENHIKTLQKSLDEQSRRTNTLEAGFERLNDIIANTVQPRLEQLHNNTANQTHQDTNDDTASEIEEIPRSSTDLQFAQSQFQRPPQEDISYATHHAITNLEHRLTSLESNHHADLTDLHRSIRDLDARTSLALMNETLRIREELAHLNGGMYSTRAQVTYLLNHHRITSQQQAMNAATRGFSTSPNYTSNVGSSGSNTHTSQAGGPSASTPSSSTAATAAAPAATADPFQQMNTTAAFSIPPTQGPSMSMPTSIPTTSIPSVSTSPIFGTTRPNLRRGSGGSGGGSRSSLDRVKL